MPTTSFRSFAPLLVYCLFFDPALSRRLHRHHHARQATTPILATLPPASITTPGVSAVTDGNAVMSDIEEIQQGLTNLPSDLVKFIGAIEQRLESLESIIASLLGGTTQATPSPAPASSEEPLPDITPIPAPSSLAPAPTLSLSTSLCRPAAGAGPLVPCPPDRSTLRMTRTSFETSTIQPPYTMANRTSVAHRTVTGAWVYPAPYSTGVPTDAATPQTVTLQYVTPPAGTISSYSPSPSSSAYTFKADAPDNVAVYYGQTPDTHQGGLLALCQDVNVDITILAFVFDFFGPNEYPTISFGPGCSGPNEVQAASAPGLQDCTALGSEITACQQMGKKVLLSLGGYIANSSFASDDQAQQFAETLWNLFGAGNQHFRALRPFGPDVVVDGFDIDNENHDTSHYGVFAQALRQQFAQDPSKTYYLSAAPQCPIPDESIPVEAMAVADFVWVQFYNNPQCNLDSAGFQSSFAEWSQNLSSLSTTPGRPRLYIGAGAFPGAGTGYVAGSGLSSAVSQARELYAENLGGVMLWDGSEGMANVDQYGVNYIEYAKAALQI